MKKVDEEKVKEFELQVDVLSKQLSEFQIWFQKRFERREDAFGQIVKYQHEYINKIIDACLDLVKISIPIVLASWSIGSPLNILVAPFLILVIICLGIVLVLNLKIKNKLIKADIQYEKNSFKLFVKEVERVFGRLEGENNKLNDSFKKFKRYLLNNLGKEDS